MKRREFVKVTTFGLTGLVGIERLIQAMAGNPSYAAATDDVAKACQNQPQVTCKNNYSCTGEGQYVRCDSNYTCQPDREKVTCGGSDPHSFEYECGDYSCVREFTCIDFHCKDVGGDHNCESGFNFGWSSHESVAVNTFRERLQVVLPSAQHGGHQWRYTTERPPENWMQPEFDDSGWKVGKSGFGTEGTPEAIVGTRWATSDIWLRTKIIMLKLSPDDAVWLEVHHDEDCEIYVNGKLLWREGGYLTRYKMVRLSPEQIALFREGENTIAVHCRQTIGGQFVDVGFVVLK